MAFVSLVVTAGRVVCLNTDLIQFVRPKEGNEWTSGAVVALKNEINVGHNVRLTTFALDHHEAIALLDELEKVR